MYNHRWKGPWGPSKCNVNATGRVNASCADAFAEVINNKSRLYTTPPPATLVLCAWGPTDRPCGSPCPHWCLHQSIGLGNYSFGWLVSSYLPQSCMVFQLFLFQDTCKKVGSGGVTKHCIFYCFVLSVICDHSVKYLWYACMAISDTSPWCLGSMRQMVWLCLVCFLLNFHFRLLRWLL